MGGSVTIELDGRKEQVETGADGRFALLQDDDGQRAIAGRAETAAEESRLEASVEFQLQSGEREVELKLLRVLRAPLHGYVIDCARKPVEGVRVRLKSYEAEQVEATSSASGRFVFESLPLKPWEPQVESPPGWALWRASRLLADPSGRWKPLVLMLNAAAALEIQIEDGAGEPVEGARVSLDLGRQELQREMEPRILALDAADAPLESKLDLAQQAWTRQTRVVGTDGRARFELVPADRSAEIMVSTLKGQAWIAERHVQSLLIWERDAPAGELIRPTAGSVLRLTAQLPGQQRRLIGRVRFPDSRPVARPDIWVRSLDRPEGEGFAPLARGAEDGSFSLNLVDLRPGERLHVKAGEREPETSGKWIHSGTAELVVGQGDLNVEIVVAPTLHISGRVVDPERPVAESRLLALPEGRVHPMDEFHPPSCVVSPAGEFLIEGMDPGTYRLVFTQPDELVSRTYEFPGIPAGTTGVTLTLPAQPRIAVSITLHAPRPIGEYVVLLAYPAEEQVRRIAADPAPISQTAARVDWPVGMPQHSTGGHDFEHTGIRFRQTLHRFEVSDQPPRQRLVLSANTYIVGVDAWDTEGRAFAPVLLQPAKYEGGEYDVDFELTSTVSLSGQVQGVDQDLGIELIALDAAGQRLPLFRGMGQARSYIPLEDSGRFELDRLPTGTVTLRVGTRHDLDHGGRVAEQTVQLEAGEAATASLRW